MQFTSQRGKSSFEHIRHVFLCASFLVIMASCGSSSSKRDLSETLQSPSWVQNLRDPMQDLPELQSETKSDYPRESMKPRLGEPRELGKRVGSTINIDERSAGSSIQASGATSNRNVFSAQIDVNLITDEISSSESSPKQAQIDSLPSMLELSYRGDLPARPDRRLTQFGYETVRMLETSSGSSAPPNPNHLAGPGDEIIVDLVTDQPRRFTPLVAGDGSIVIPDLGSFDVGGMTRTQLLDYLTNEISRVRRNFELRVGFGTIATIPIRVSGEVQRGGVIQLDPRGDLLDVLGAAGIRKSGTLRNIRVVRSNGDSVEIDLYQYLLGLAPPPVLHLTQGDSVLVPSIGRSIAVAGSVQRPGIYELAHEQELNATLAIELAGGSTGFSVVDAVQLERTGDVGRELIDIEGDRFGDSLVDGDLILVGAVEGRLHPVVEARGSLLTPGRFQFRSGMTVGDLVRMSGGLEVDAYPEQAILSRLQGSRVARNTELDAGSLSSSRRVMIVNIEKALSGDPEHDLVLSPLDLLRVQKFTDARDLPLVEIIGAVRQPGKYEQTSGLRIGDLLALSGNLTSDAHRQQAELIRRRRTDSSSILDVSRYRINLESILRNDTRGPLLENGDQIVIRRLRRAEVRVQIDGMVRFPGEYILPAGSKITDLLASAGGTLNDADIRASRFTRVSVRNTQLDRWQELTERNRQRLEGVLEERVNSARSKEATAARIQMKQTESLLARLKNKQADGRVVIPFTNPGFPDSEYNLALESGDRLSIPRNSQTVSVLGNVFNPLTVIHEDSLTTESLIEQAGGITELADEDRVYVVRADGRVEGAIQKSGKFRLNQPLLAGDIVLVPKRVLDRDFGSIVLDLLQTARTAGEAAALWNLATSNIEEANVSVIAPAEQRNDQNHLNEMLDEFQSHRRD
ncbi:MAG: SLBB domain-containing protein [Phycisphaerales bacterium]|nr:SLBB domain-containing protein [Phycisphaerales bacterium]